MKTKVFRDELSVNQIKFLIYLILLRPQFSNELDRVIDLLIFLILIVLELFLGLKYKNRVSFWLVGNYLVLLSMLFSYLNGIFNNEKYLIEDFFEFYRPIFNILLVIIGANFSNSYQFFFPMIIKTVLAIQFVFIFGQLTNIGGFIDSPVSLFYNMEKVSLNTLRVVGTYANPNTLGFVLNMLFFYLFSYYNQFKIKKRNDLFLFFILFLQLIFVFLSSSRTSLIFMIFGYSIFFVLGQIRISRKLKQYFLFFGGLIVLIIVSHWESVLIGLKSFRYILEIVNRDILEIRAIQLRMAHFTNIIEMIKQNPFWGIGANKSLLRVGDNDYLFTLAQYGIVGAILKYGLFFVVFYKLWKINKREANWMIQGTLLSFIFISVAGLTLDSFYNYNFLSLILINSGFCLANSRIIIIKSGDN